MAGRTCSIVWAKRQNARNSAEPGGARCGRSTPDARRTTGAIYLGVDNEIGVGYARPFAVRQGMEERGND
ncbi:hypothetical protein Ssi02_31560 [Sinosporangium siamense]|uniref:Uncharacterized protein n=1 Tax=Sinosporangium siamense TaxID=1367973 RepID=A0A919V5E5_9ACTN|nr:hypothetical protein Ssi02_31560 [Sinosporangium siamense]